jgi:hypothetical protein
MKRKPSKVVDKDTKRETDETPTAAPDTNQGIDEPQDISQSSIVPLPHADLGQT